MFWRSLFWDRNLCIFRNRKASVPEGFVPPMRAAFGIRWRAMRGNGGLESLQLLRRLLWGMTEDICRNADIPSGRPEDVAASHAR